MYVLLKNNVCIGINSLKIEETGLAEDEKQVKLENSEEDPLTLLGTTYVNGKFVTTPKTDREKQTEENLIQTLYLSETDWQVIRHRDQLELGIETSLTETEYKNLLEMRQKAREAVIKMD